MFKKTIFQGAATALITPTTPDGVDYAALRSLIDWQINSGINALVICGTTGESATLSDKERREVLRVAAEAAAGRVPMIAGTGSNNTAAAVELSRYACSVGYDAVLAVTPYYNKATQNGLVAMYSAIADAAEKPVIIYNVPSRTGVGIEPETYLRLSAHPNIAAVKEACGDISKIARTAALTQGRLDLYSGNDDQIVPILALGGKGVISVLSNLLPGETARLCTRFFSGDLVGSREMQLRYLPLISALFSEVNPIPVKAAMAAMGRCENYLRLPLTPMEEPHRQRLLDAMREAGIRV